MKLIGALFFFILIAPMVQAQHYSPPADALHALDGLTQASLVVHIRFLSSDLLEGRAPGTRGDLLTRSYIASQMELLGLRPGGDDGTFFQHVPLIAMKSDPSATILVRGKGSTLELKFGDDFVGFTGNQKPEVVLKDAEAIFVGYGIVAPEQQWDDFKGVDMRGKVLIMLNNDPATDDPGLFAGKARTYYGRWTYKYEIAARKGAAGAIIIHTTPSASYGWNVVRNSWSGERSELTLRPDEPTTAFKGWTTFEATAKMLDLAGIPYDSLEAMAQSRSFHPVPLGILLSTTLRTRMKEIVTANVIGVLPGSDSKVQDEAVLYTAHHDHFGIGHAVDGDSIYNGALDNATGVSAVLNIARTVASLPQAPRRTMVFATVAAEEQGLLGSQFLAAHPPFPPGKIVANINVDALGVSGRTKDVILIGFGKSSLDATVKSVAAWQGRVVQPDQFPEKGSFYRSDQLNFAKIGVPCMFLKSGLDVIGRPAGFGRKKDEEYTSLHYHQPSDEIRPDWDLSGTVEEIRLLFLVGLAVGNSETVPVWNPGDEFEAARKASRK